MMDIASLGFKIDTSDVSKAETALDSLAATGAKTETSARGVGDAWAAVGRKAGSAAAPIAATASAFKQGSDAIKAQQAELSKLLGQIDPVVAALGRLDDQEQELRRHKAAGLVDADTFRDYSSKIDLARNSLSGIDGTIRKTGVSSAQTANALRQLPAQFTDIFTSLAGGQNPLLVLIQQGGQIKDSFGGIGETFQALGAQVRGLFSTTASGAAGIGAFGEALADVAQQQAAVAQGTEQTSEGLVDIADSANSVVDAAGNASGAIGGVGAVSIGMVAAVLAGAAAVATLALAYKQGSDEGSAFNKALTLTGNFAGTTSGQLADMARQMDQVNGTQRQAAAALAEVTATGRFTAMQIREIAASAVAMEEATGKAVSDTIAEFKRLGDEPAAASAKLNDQYNYLTASVYAQIAALEAQGNEAGAAQLAIDTFGDVMERRASEIEGSLGLIESAWSGIKNVAAEAWDEMLGIGRELSIQEQLREVQEDRRRSGFDVRGEGRVVALSPERAAKFDAEEQRLTLAQQSQGLDAAAEGLRAENQKTAIQGLNLIGREAESTQSSVEKLRERLADLGKAKDFNVANRSFTPAAQAQFEKSTAAINKQIADAEERANRPKKAPRAATVRDDEATRLLLTLRGQEATLMSQLITTEKLSAAQTAQIEFTQTIADIKNKDILTADQRSLLANQDGIAAQLAQNVALDAQIRGRQELAKLAEQAARKQDKVNAQARGVADSLMTEEERVLASYERRRQIILDNTAITGEAQTNLLTKLEEERNDELLAINGSYWERYLKSAEKSLGNFDELAASSVDGFASRFGSAFEAIVFEAQSAEDAAKGMAEGMARSVVNALGQMSAQWLAYQAVQLLVGKTTQASAATAMAANASAMAVTAGLNAFASTAAIPIVGAVAAPAAAAAALAITVPMASAVGALALAGMAHDGIDYIPQEGTWLLDKGERVVDARTNADLTRFLSAGRDIALASTPASNTTNSNNNSNRSITVNVTAPQDDGRSSGNKVSAAQFGRKVARAINGSQRFS